MDLTVLALLAWGTAVGVDLIAGPQLMIARPLVAGTVAGFIVGDVTTGASIGLVLELFAWDVLPFGAARYPDYGLGAIAGVWTAAHAPGVLGLGVAVGVALVVAYLGELSVQAVRRMNSADLERRTQRLDDGLYTVARNMHLRGIAREILRSLGLSGAGLAIGAGVHRLLTFGVDTAVAATIVAAGLGIGLSVSSGVRLIGSTKSKQVWYATGLALGVVWVVLS